MKPSYQKCTSETTSMIAFFSIAHTIPPRALSAPLGSFGELNCAGLGVMSLRTGYRRREMRKQQPIGVGTEVNGLRRHHPTS